MGLSTEWTRSWPSTGLVSGRKNGGGSDLFQWWMLLFINKGEADDSLLLLSFRRHVVNTICLTYSKERRISFSHVGIRNIPSAVCYDDTKH